MHMKYALYLGCATPVKGLKYEISTRNLARRLGIHLVDVPEFGCCGFPVKSMHSSAALLMAARNLALAEEKGMDIIGVCTGCMAVLSEAKECLENEALRNKVNEKLRSLGVREYTGTVRIKHFARFLFEEYGLAAVREKIVMPLEHLQFGVHYGCHYAKPSSAHGRFDDPSHPATLDELIMATGARTVDYPGKNLCCGLTAMGISENIGVALAAGKLESLSQANVDAMAVACPSCCVAYENNQRLIAKKSGKEFELPVLFFSQILGLAAGLSAEDLGFDYNRISAERILEKAVSKST